MSRIHITFAKIFKSSKVLAGQNFWFQELLGPTFLHKVQGILSGQDLCTDIYIDMHWNNGKHHYWFSSTRKSAFGGCWGFHGCENHQLEPRGNSLICWNYITEKKNLQLYVIALPLRREIRQLSLILSVWSQFSLGLSDDGLQRIVWGKACKSIGGALTEIQPFHLSYHLSLLSDGIEKKLFRLLFARVLSLWSLSTVSV